MSRPHRLILILLIIGLASCGSYKQNIMFIVGPGTKVARQVASAEANYTIQKNDYIELNVYDEKGERLIDPKNELLKDMPNGNVATQKEKFQYLVDSRGLVKFPIIDELKLDGLTVRQAEAIVQQQYEAFYTGNFVVLKVVSRRAIVLGSPDGKVIPLVNENVNLAEVLALAGGIKLDGKAHNIRVLRGDQVFVADFSTIEGYLASNMTIQSGDIVYVEPVRRPFLEGLRDTASLISLAVSIGTLIYFVTRN